MRKALMTVLVLLAGLGMAQAGSAVKVKVTAKGEGNVKRALEKGVKERLKSMKDVKLVGSEHDCEIQITAFNVQTQEKVKLGYAVTAVYLQRLPLPGRNQAVGHFLGVWTQVGPYEDMEKHGANVADYYRKNVHPSLKKMGR